MNNFVELLNREIEELNHIIDTGGYGTVKKIRYMNEIVALKVFDRKKNLAEACIKEVKQLKRLNHENIIKIMKEGRYEQCSSIYHVFIMEYADFGSLHKIIHDQKDLDYTLGHAISWLYQISCAVAYLHSYEEKPITHRDLKPLNILLAKGGTLVKLCDFGTARDVHTLMTSEKGTYVYMAPEVLKGTDYKAKYDETCDVYSYGIVMWEIFTRKRPYFDKPNLNSYIIIHKVGESLKPTRISKLPKVFELLYECCLHKNSKKRPNMSFIKEIMSKLNKSINEIPIRPLVKQNLVDCHGFSPNSSLSRGSSHKSKTRIQAEYFNSSALLHNGPESSLLNENIQVNKFNDLNIKDRNYNSFKRDVSFSSEDKVNHFELTSASNPTIPEALDDYSPYEPLKPLAGNKASYKLYEKHCELLKKEEKFQTKIDKLNKKKDGLVKILEDQYLYLNLLNQKDILRARIAELEARILNSTSTVK